MSATTRERILDAAQQLFYAKGVGAVSPAAIQKKSRAGQGSFYHHFPSKSKLVQESLQRVSLSMIGSGDEIFAPEKKPVQQILDFLHASRNALGGCQLGRFAYEDDLIRNEKARKPMAAYFADVEGRLARALQDAGLSPENAVRLARSTLAAVQGAYILARVHQQESLLSDALRGQEELLLHTIGAASSD